MKKLIIVCLVLSLFLCGCESKDNKSNDNQLANDIKENIENLLKVNSGSSSNPYDYIHTEYYNDIVNLGEDAIPVLIKMYKDGEFSKDGLDSYIISIAIQEIANCSLYNKYQLSYANPSEFFDLWEKYNCGFYPYGIDSDVSLEVMEKTITDKGATFVLKNNTSNDYWYGPEYVIEKKENGKWYMEMGATIDERIADGFYFCKALKLIEYIFDTPELMLEPAGKKVEIPEDRK